MLYYSRIQSDGINPLVKEALNININISNENIYTWYTFATEIFKEVELKPFQFVDVIVITVHDLFWNIGQANCILKYFENMMIDHSDSTIF
jgi:dTDP-4-dehydrorhamnose reductase